MPAEGAEPLVEQSAPVELEATPVSQPRTARHSLTPVGPPSAAKSSHSLLMSVAANVSSRHPSWKEQDKHAPVDPPATFSKIASSVAVQVLVTLRNVDWFAARKALHCVCTVPGQVDPPELLLELLLELPPLELLLLPPLELLLELLLLPPLELLPPATASQVSVADKVLFEQVEPATLAVAVTVNVPAELQVKTGLADVLPLSWPSLDDHESVDPELTVALRPIVEPTFVSVGLAESEVTIPQFCVPTIVLTDASAVTATEPVEASG